MSSSQFAKQLTADFTLVQSFPVKYRFAFHRVNFLTGQADFKYLFCCLKIKKYWGWLGNLVLICEILWLLFGVWYGLCFLIFDILFPFSYKLLTYPKFFVIIKTINHNCF